MQNNETFAQLLRATLDAVPLGVVVADASGRVVFRNLRAAHLGDPRTADVLLADAVSELMRAAAGGEAQARTIELRGPPPRTLEVSVAPLVEVADAGVGSAPRVPTAAVIADVSERRQLDAVRRDFVANVSHELRTPVGALGLLAETLAGEVEAEVARRLADRISTEAERLSRIIDDLLDLSSIEVEGLADRSPVAVSQVLAASADRVSALAARHQVDLVIPTGADGPWVLGVEGHLVSAVTNLLDNAVKYSEPGSTVVVDVAASAGWVNLAVADQGIGIPGRDHERIFERFYRVDQARSRGTGGTGLGLAIVRHVATNHGGDVRVESQEGEGSTFTLRLPQHIPPGTGL